MSDLATGSIWSAIQCLEREAQFRRNIGNNSNYERARDLDHAYKQAMAEYRQLSDALPRLRSLKDAADREYDRYVTREPESCSCHISAPCGYCTSQSDEDEDASDA